MTQVTSTIESRRKMFLDKKFGQYQELLTPEDFEDQRSYPWQPFVDLYHKVKHDK